ncbi:MAG: hypothetical protein LBL96_01495 [Clostridiales bacterium]|jgi:hypothetical protein|nr:hypothetical protein [Clostridiales bacterium]
MYNDQLTGDCLLSLLEDLNQFVQDFTDTFFCLQNDLLRMERRKQDFLHLIENDVEGRLTDKYMNDLHMHLRERRYIKNQLELLDSARVFMDTIHDGKLKNAVGDMRKVRERQEHWVYNPKEMTSDEVDNYYLADDIGEREVMEESDLSKFQEIVESA